MRFINKDPEGFVPISVVASIKKIKALVSSHSQLATVLWNSSKLVVHEDGKNVRRQHPLTQSDMEELQPHIVVAENLPEDHCHQNLMKIFSAAGSVKTIRTCQPQTSNSNSSSASRSAKADGMHFSNNGILKMEYCFWWYYTNIVPTMNTVFVKLKSCMSFANALSHTVTFV
ncbi:la-related protein 6B-like [Rosa rugosa]|uniref:la-related protein 6B-like n=1 Tax=Rosa rugosa TaxID=74645 RepID=UPI002B415442|nr:la-related protein 6B-like [Rosa rugosa]XP_062010105.1 la-related protein 6B-like [Rosa rugosa]